MTFEEFQALYGTWRGLLPTEVSALLADAPFRWWIAGGWAIEAASGQSRLHEDTDVIVLRRDLSAVRQRLADLHLWEAHEGALRPLRAGDDIRPEVEQIWVRRDSSSPWLLDVLITATEETSWLYKRDPTIRLPLDEIGWTGPDGVPYLRPAIVLLFKAKLARGKDEDDFHAMVPKLDDTSRRWLRDALTATLPAHPWLASIEA